MGESCRKSAAIDFVVLRNFPIRAVNNTYSQVIHDSHMLTIFCDDFVFSFLGKLQRKKNVQRALKCRCLFSDWVVNFLPVQFFGTPFAFLKSLLADLDNVQNLVLLTFTFKGFKTRFYIDP